MGQTLTHGVYLPDEGERNCYAGLAGNWSILDGAVGAIAEHTAQIAGKAPLGHTHTKADVTDLLNSNFIPSANNSYDLGSSSYQWNNLYAKNYYYNGVAWGLDKANVWTGNNQFNVSVKFSGQTGINWARGGTTGTLPSSVLYYGFQNALDSNNNVFDRIRSYISTTGTNLQEHIKYAWNDLTKYVTINFWINADGSDSEYKLSVKRVIPGSSNETDLGNSTYKWKTLNGINPGALSLPDLTSNGYINLSDNISANTEYSYTPHADGWLALYVLTTGFHVENAVGIFNGSSSGNAHRLACSATSGINLARSNYYHGAVLLPVIAGIPYLCWIKIDSSTTLASKVLYFYKSAGNV